MTLSIRLDGHERHWKTHASRARTEGGKSPSHWRLSGPWGLDHDRAFTSTSRRRGDQKAKIRTRPPTPRNPWLSQGETGLEHEGIAEGDQAADVAGRVKE